MISPELLKILVCPETRQELTLADASVVEKLNRAIRDGSVLNRGNEKVVEAVEGGLIRKDGRFLYPIRSGIPILLIEEALPLNA